ncbi:hypothetical protein FB446DRAFT_796006 [Lentinula raphanica]|nr:hypothetical protein FB446DRAFT_796006 [Lentinula raphanica]
MSDPTNLSPSTTMSDLLRPAIIIPMPVPGMPDAPKFEGRDTREFLEQIEAHGLRAGIADKDKLVDYIVRYSTPKVRSGIRYLPEFDPEEEDKTWDEAKKMLMQMFSAQDEPPEVSIRDLEDSCIVWATAEPFTRKAEVDRYQQKFFTIAAPLIKQKLLTKNLKGYYFLQGLPKKDQKYVERKLPEENKKKANPPSVEMVIKLIQQKIDNKESVLHHSWDSEDEDVEEIRERLKSRLKLRDEESSEEEGGKTKKVGERKKVKKVRIEEEEERAPEWQGKKAMEEITRRMDDLSLSMARMASQQTPGRAGMPTRPDGTRFCFVELGRF